MSADQVETARVCKTDTLSQKMKNLTKKPNDTLTTVYSGATIAKGSQPPTQMRYIDDIFIIGYPIPEKTDKKEPFRDHLKLENHGFSLLKEEREQSTTSLLLLLLLLNFNNHCYLGQHICQYH